MPKKDKTNKTCYYDLVAVSNAKRLHINGIPKLYAAKGKVFIVIDYGDNGFDVFLPVDDKGEITITLEKLQDFLQS